MMLISAEYLRLNAELHARNPGYGTSGAHWAPLVYGLARKKEARTVLDYGAGKGTLFRAVHAQFSDAPLPFECLEYDPAIEGKTEKPAHADIVVCGDVLEHIEHLIVEPSAWWLPKILDRWKLQSFKDYGPMFMCVGLAR